MRTIIFPGYSSLLKFAVVLVAIIFTATAARAEERKALPVDEAGKDTAFAAFRDKLVDAVVRRSPVDRRAIFEKRDGAWLMVTFIAGD